VRYGVGDRVADCPRIGLSLEADAQNRAQLVQFDYDQKVIDAQAKELTLKDLMISDQKARGDLFQADAQRERESADKARASEKTSFWVGVGAGFLTILLGAWSVRQVSK
jgi:hypothetical protein